MIKYVIFKDSRLYHGGPGYSGPSCNSAGVEHGKIYESRDEAEVDRNKLSNCNPGVGWDVLRHFENKQEDKWKNK